MGHAEDARTTIGEALGAAKLIDEFNRDTVRDSIMDVKWRPYGYP